MKQKDIFRMREVAWLALVAIATFTSAQSTAKKDAGQYQNKMTEARLQTVARAEADGVSVRIKDIAHFKGVTPNQLQGIGLVVGLNGTGDTQNTPLTTQLLANAMADETFQNTAQLLPKNCALVSVSAELPPFASPGNRIDVEVASMGDATSLQGGYLLRTVLYGPFKATGIIAAAMGPVSIGGFNVNRAGSSVQKNHTTVGRLPDMGIVVQGIATNCVDKNGNLDLQLSQEDFTTAQRMADQINLEYPQYRAAAVDAGLVQVVLAPNTTMVQEMSQVEEVHFLADTPATVVISENTGTVVMGGNVRIGPAVVAKGSLTVRIDQQMVVSQPNALSLGQTTVNPQAQLQVKEDTAQITEMGPTTSVSDLAVIFAALKISATDIIAILEALRDQGALKAEIRIQ